MNLPSGSMLTLYTLESPQFLVALLIIGAGFAWFGLRFRFPRQSLIATGLLLASAAGLVVLASLVETTGERLGRETRLLVEAALSGDAAGFGALLEDDLVVRVGRDRSSLDKGDLVERIKALKQLIKSNNVREARGVSTGPGTGESVLAQTTTTQMAAPTPNEWRFRWRRDVDGQWRITEMIWERWGLKEIPTADLLRP